MSAPPWSNTPSKSGTSNDPDMINLYNQNPAEIPNNEQPKSNDPNIGVAGGAAIAGGVVGSILAGPLIGVVAAVGVGALAFQKNPAGDAARASGEVVCATGDKVKVLNEEHQIAEKTKAGASVAVNKAQEFDEEHRVVDKTRRGLADVGESMRKFDQQHKVVEKTAKGFANVGQSIKKFDEEHRVVEKTTKGLANSCHWLANMIKGNDKSNGGGSSK